MCQIGQMGLHVEHEHNLFIKWVSCVNSNMIRTCLVSTYDLFINRLVVLGLQVRERERERVNEYNNNKKRMI